MADVLWVLLCLANQTDVNLTEELHEYLKKQNVVDIAEFLHELDDSTLAIFFRVLEKEEAANVFSYLDNEERNRLIKCI